MRKRNTLIFVVVLVVVGAAYVLAVQLPQSRRMNRVRDEIACISQQYEADAAKAKQIPQMKAEVAELKSEFQDFDRRLPRQRELGEFLREISATGAAGRLDDQMIKPGNPTTGTLYNRLPILMDFTCTFPEVVEFLDRLNAMPRLTRVERIDLSPTDDGSKLKVHMQVNIYFTNT